LQERVAKLQLERKEKMTEKTLHLDVKTRWNSMITMLNSVLQVNFLFVLVVI
jgi:hypothetical protein